MEKVRSASQFRQAEAAKGARRKLNKDKKRIAELDTIMANAVSSYMSGQMSLDEAMSFFSTEMKKALQNNPPPEGSKNTNAIAISEALGK